MSLARVPTFLVSIGLSVGALAIPVWLASTGCSSSGAANTGDPGTGGNGDDGGSTTDDGGGGGGDGGSGGDDGGGSGADTGPALGKDGGGPCSTNTGPITGTVGATGGSISRLVFGVVGDTRPVNEDDPSTYPTPIITKIFQDLQAESPRPPLVVATGDYQFSSTGSRTTSHGQISTYMQARAAFTGAFFPAMGNHECGVSGSFTTSDNNDCGPGNPGGVTPNYTEFMNQMLGPIAKTTPYYSFNVNATDNTWTAKFVVTAANAWSTAQQSWLETTMAQPTTYTFVMRHQASDAYPPLPPGVAGVDAIIAQHPYTLLIVGHAHTYGHYKSVPKAMIIGNGGAPLTSKNYGYAMVSQRCDGPLVVDEVDYMSGAKDPQFHFVITPDGTLTQ